jgi:hypothetical protein
VESGHESSPAAAMAWRCAAMFRPSLAGVCGSVITRASTGDREEGHALEQAEVHGAVLATVTSSSGEVPHMAVVVEMTNAASP